MSTTTPTRAAKPDGKPAAGFQAAVSNSHRLWVRRGLPASLEGAGRFLRGHRAVGIPMAVVGVVIVRLYSG
jgi:hypothetical protein